MQSREALFRLAKKANKKLREEFFIRDTLTVAKDLLGKFLEKDNVECILVSMLLQKKKAEVVRFWLREARPIEGALTRIKRMGQGSCVG